MSCLTKNKTFIFIIAYLLLVLPFSAQSKLGSILRGEKELDFGFNKKMDKMKQEFDESNFNYAISFLDNSGLFESKEKGSTLKSMLLNNSKTSSSYNESTAYNQLKQGEMLMASNKFQLAEQSFLQAKANYETPFINDSTNYAQALSNLSLVYQNRGLYAKAIPMSDSAITIRKALYNKGMLAVSYNNRGVLLKDIGKFIEAETFVKNALTILTEKNDELGLALAKNNLAMVYTDMNKLKDAEVLMKESLQHAGKVLGEKSSNYIKLEINLANVYKLQKKYEDAEPVYKYAIFKKESALGAHPDLAHLKSGLAQLYMEMGRYNEVEKLLQSAYDINKRKLGEANPATVKVMQEQANYYRITGDNSKAYSLITRVLDYKKSIYGEAHPSYLQALEDMAIIQWNLNELDNAITNYNQVLENTRNYIASYFSTLNENEKNAYWEKTRLRIQRYTSFVHANYKDKPELIGQLLNTVMVTKGFLLNGSSKLRNSIMQSDDAELKIIFKKYLDTKEQLNSAYQLSKEELAEENINIDSLQKASDDYERKLALKSSLFEDSKSGSVSNYTQVQSLLKNNEAAIEIIQVNEFKNVFTGKANYLALALTNSQLMATEISEADTINASVAQFRSAIIDQLNPPDIFSIVWRNIDTCLKGINKIYLSLDGAYHQLSINSLKDEKGVYLLDKYNMQLVGNLKDVVSLKNSESKIVKPKTAFLVGNPYYGANDLITQLPGTEKEVKYITGILKGLGLSTTSLYGKEATETKIKAINSPNILHIATHGYFLADVSQMETNKVLGVDISVARENPLLRSGLLFANCDNVFDENYKPVGSDNGVLTAYEVMSLNLDKTDLVVLSACETGLGSVKQGEGVYGLQRAFLIAGAKSIIMSLWSVSDDATMELMMMFYSNYAKTGNKLQSFTEAQKKLKTKYKDPFYWGAFVMLNI